MRPLNRLGLKLHEAISSNPFSLNWFITSLKISLVVLFLMLILNFSIATFSGKKTFKEYKDLF